MTNFGNNDSIKIKDIRLINSIKNSIIDNTLNWNITYKSDTITAFVSNYHITKNKKLVFTVQTNRDISIKDGNTLKILFKRENEKGDSSIILKKLHLLDYPILRIVIDNLNKKYLGITQSIIPNNKTELVVANNIVEYRNEILSLIKKNIKLIYDKNNWESKFNDIINLYNACKKSTSYEEMNDLLYKSNEILNK